PQSVEPEDDAAVPLATARLGACDAVAATPWPLTLAGRQVLLRRLEAMRERCMDRPAFLAMLGGAWLEDGDPAQALVWLERALLLDPDSLPARADHALALAALGEPAALRELALEWQRRPDMPALLRARIEAGLDGVVPGVRGSNGRA